MMTGIDRRRPVAVERQAGRQRRGSQRDRLSNGQDGHPVAPGLRRQWRRPTVTTDWTCRQTTLY
jgi:hypothetical protein